MTGNIVAPDEVTGGSGSSGGRLGSPHASGPRAWLARSQSGADRLGGYWFTAPGKVMLIAMVLAVAIRLFTLLRSGYLTGITEYDDGQPLPLPRRHPHAMGGPGRVGAVFWRP